MNKLHIQPLSVQTWNDFETLFTDKGGCNNCWCMLYRRNNKDFTEGKKNGSNRTSMKQLVDQNTPTGLIVYQGNEPISWVSFAPREILEKMKRSRVHKPIDNQPVWSITCMFVAAKHRKQGQSVPALEAVIDYANSSGIKIIEAYPTVPNQTLPDPFVWTGLLNSFLKAGFKIVDQTSKNRPMVRYYL